MPPVSLSNVTRATKRSTAEYIAVEASRLARLANANKLDLLAYLIDVVVLEAWREASEPRGSQDGPPPSAGPAQAAPK